jgi:putative transferase (TIGR04331 family)
LTKQKRYLVTTADEATWKFDKPVIFLGEWCRIYDRKHIWQNIDAIVAKPYGLGESKKDTDYSKIISLEQKLFPELCTILNKYFDKQYSERFWQIILGHWFRTILQILLNRINTLKQCFQSYEISGTTIFKNEDYLLATADNATLTYACEDDLWNNILNGHIINILAKSNFPIEFIQEVNHLDMRQRLKFKRLDRFQYNRNNIFTWCSSNYFKIARKFIKNVDAFIINSYLPLAEEIKLELSLGQCPQLWKLQSNTINQLNPIKVPDRLSREKLTNQFTFKSDCDFEKIVRLLLFELLPVCYLEGFKEIEDIAKQQPWPKSPKFIFTSNNFQNDEVFKFWAASKVESGFKYYIGQHGSNYGKYKNEYSPTIEEITSDKFITWGFKDELPQHTPAFVFKTVGIKKKNYNSKGGLLLIEMCQHYRRTTHDALSEYIKYFNDQKKFVKRLSKTSKKKLTIRLHSELRTWNEKARWLDFDSSLKFDNGRINIQKLISKNRLVVHSYDSTGLIETLSQNIPTLAFWQNDLEHVKKSALPYYQSLINTGIVHLSAESVADKVNEIWHDVDGWWNQAHVQDARKQFCERYAKTHQSPVSELKRILLS